MAKTVYIKDSTRNEIVAASLIDDVTESQLAAVGTRWRDAARALKASARQRSIVLHLEHDHWDWTLKRKVLNDSRIVGIADATEIQGLMLYRSGVPCKLKEQLEKTLVYIEYIEVAPWNLVGLAYPRKYERIGSILIEAAINVSWEIGCEGRIGLISLKQSVKFYRICGMIEFWVEYGST